MSLPFLGPVQLLTNGARCWVVLGALLLAGKIHAATLAGTVVGVSDGDTITVLTEQKEQVKVRLAGIDAPERGQAFGQRAKIHLSEGVFGRVVTVEWAKVDRYGRTIGQVFHAGSDINLEQVRAGMAWHYTAYAKEQSAADRERYSAAQKEAAAARIGLWADKNPIAPWDFRKTKGTGRGR